MKKEASIEKLNATIIVLLIAFSFSNHLLHLVFQSYALYAKKDDLHFASRLCPYIN